MEIDELFKYIPEFKKSKPKDKSFLSFLLWGKQRYPNEFLSIDGYYVDESDRKFPLSYDIDKLIKVLKK